MSSLQKALAKEKIESGDRKHNRTRKKAPTVTTAYQSSTDDDDSSSDNDDLNVDTNEEKQQQKEGEDMIKIRQQAFRVLNTPSSGPNAEAAKKNHDERSFVSPYQQQQSAGPSASPMSSYQSSSPSAMHEARSYPHARTAEPLSVKSMLVNCVSEVCQSSSSELFQKVLSAGYQSVSNYETPPVNGAWDETDTSQHGYGNGNNAPSKYSGSKNGGGNMPSRYQDWFTIEISSVECA